MHRVLIIAGSDPSGGAGIQADLKTITCLGAYGMTAITALTVQNTLGVTDVFAIPETVIAGQAMACIEDIGVDAVKTGMLGSISVVETVSSLLDLAGDAFKVIDPVMVAKGGHKLLPEAAIEAIIHLLIPRADLLTPNAPEAEVLTGLKVHTVEDMERAGRLLLKMGAKAILMKGGHVEGDPAAGGNVVDLLVTPDGVSRFSTRRINTRHTHGTGCTLASACAALYRPDLTLRDVVAQARDYVQSAIKAAPGLGGGHGPLKHNWAFKS